MKVEGWEKRTLQLFGRTLSLDHRQEGVKEALVSADAGRFGERAAGVGEGTQGGFRL